MDIYQGLSMDTAENLASKLEFKGDLKKKAAVQIHKLYELFLKVDATQVEINPLAETSDNRGSSSFYFKFSEIKSVNECCQSSCVLIQYSASMPS